MYKYALLPRLNVVCVGVTAQQKVHTCIYAHLPHRRMAYCTNVKLLTAYSCVNVHYIADALLPSDSTHFSEHSGMKY